MRLSRHLYFYEVASFFTSHLTINLMFQISELSSIALFVRVGVDLAVRRLDARLPLSALPGLARRVLASCAAHLVPTAIRIVCPVAEAHSRRQTIAEYAPHTGTDTPRADHVASRGTAWNSALSDIVQRLSSRSRSQSMCPKRRLVTVGSPSISQSEKHQSSARGDALRILLWALEGADKSEIQIGANSKLGPISSPISPISSPEPDLLRTRTRLPKA